VARVNLMGDVLDDDMGTEKNSLNYNNGGECVWLGLRVVPAPHLSTLARPSSLPCSGHGRHR